VIGDATIIVLGNESAPSTVRVPARMKRPQRNPFGPTALTCLSRQAGGRGIRFEYTKKDWQEGFYERGEKRGAGLYVDRGSSVSVAFCQFMDNDNGLWADNGSFVMAENIECGRELRGVILGEFRSKPARGRS
jgi:hypothetical protein